MYCSCITKILEERKRMWKGEGKRRRGMRKGEDEGKGNGTYLDPSLTNALYFPFPSPFHVKIIIVYYASKKKAIARICVKNFLS